MPSRFFGFRKPAKEHMTRGGGRAGEITDLRRDVEAAFAAIQNEQIGTPTSFTPLLVPEILNNGSWWSPSRGITGLGTANLVITDQCPNPVNMTTDTANGIPSLLPLGVPPVFVGTGGTAGMVAGAYNAVPAAKLQGTTSLYVAAWMSMSGNGGTIASLISQYTTAGTTGNKMFALYAPTGTVNLRIRSQDDSANVVASFPQPRVNEPHFIEGVYRNATIELWRDRVLMVSVPGPVSMPNTLTPTNLFNEGAKGNPFNGKAGNIYLSTLVPSDANRNLLYSFERLQYNRERLYVTTGVTLPTLGTATLATVSVNFAASATFPPFFPGGDPIIATPIIAIPGGGIYLGGRVTGLNLMDLYFLGPLTAGAVPFAFDRLG